MPRTNKSALLLAEEIYRLVNRSRRHLWMTAARCLEARGESIFPWQIVCYLVRNGATNQRDLAYATAQHPAGVSRLVEELEGAGLVTRTADPADRRRLLVDATARGRAWLEGATPDVIAAVDGAMAALTHDERVTLRALLERMLSAGDGGTKKAASGR